MANSRVWLTCKHCGEGICIGTGYFGSYNARNKNLVEDLEAFYRKHEYGVCSDTCCSDEARDHFVILDDGETLADFCKEQIGCQNCIFRQHGADHWKCHIEAFDLQDVLWNI